jgi:hypothetical protein
MQCILVLPTSLPSRSPPRGHVWPAGAPGAIERQCDGPMEVDGGGACRVQCSESSCTQTKQKHQAKATEIEQKQGSL